MQKRDTRFRLLIGKLAILALSLTASLALAQSFGMKQGLWEFKSLKTVVDGADTSAQLSAAQAQMQQAMANLSPEQRQQMEAMMKSRGVGVAGGSPRQICVSAAMAGSNKPVVDPQGKCAPASVSRDGNKTRFEFNCTSDGRTTIGKGESTNSGDTVTTVMDATTTDAKGQHTMHSETEMTYLGSDCQGVKPLDAALGH